MPLYRREGQRIGGFTLCMIDENSELPKQEVSLLIMSNNEISHFTDERSLEMQPIMFCN